MSKVVMAATFERGVQGIAERLEFLQTYVYSQPGGECIGMSEEPIGDPGNEELRAVVWFAVDMPGGGGDVQDYVKDLRGAGYEVRFVPSASPVYPTSAAAPSLHVINGGRG